MANGLSNIILPCNSNRMEDFGGKRAIITVDTPFHSIIKDSVGHLIVRESQGVKTGHIPVVSYYYVDGYALSMSRLLFNKRFIKRVNPLAFKDRNTYYFNESMDNFSLSDHTKWLLLSSNRIGLKPYILKQMTTMGHLLDEVGPERFKYLTAGLRHYDHDRKHID